MNYHGIAIEDFYPLTQVAEKLRRPYRTVEKWPSPGLRNGTVRLETMLIGGVVHTCDRWLGEFLDALNAHREIKAPPRRRSPAERQRSSRSAQRELEGEN